MTVPQKSVDRVDFVGRYLAEIGLGAGTISLRLANLGRPGATSMVLVVISAPVVLHVGGTRSELAPTPESVSALSPLLNEDITDVQLDGNSRIHIEFGPGRFIEICSDPNGLETASVSVPGKEGLVI